MSDTPASPITVLDALARRYCGWRIRDMTPDPMPVGEVDRVRANADLTIVLGIDPDMSVERLRADLAIAARARAETGFNGPRIEGYEAGWNACLDRIVEAQP